MQSMVIILRHIARYTSIMIKGIVTIEIRVDMVTSFDTYAESQSNFSANIVAEVAAGADDIMMTTIETAG